MAIAFKHVYLDTWTPKHEHPRKPNTSLKVRRREHSELHIVVAGTCHCPAAIFVEWWYQQPLYYLQNYRCTGEIITGSGE